MPHPAVRKLTPVLFVDRIEPSLGFWTALGFEKVVEVPEDDGLGFVLLAKDGIEVMYQSRTSLRKDVPAVADAPSASALYIEVDDLAEVARRIAGAPVVVPRRTTFYGMEEFGVREPAGNLVTFSRKAEAP
jgi:uncharacterized glyoxalase superfamily protein PhnB